MKKADAVFHIVAEPVFHHSGDGSPLGAHRSVLPENELVFLARIWPLRARIGHRVRPSAA
eukprot:CAMPEP_0185837024 /NCGR_PEP_ID=MMETSP1353-20130828/10666_1 /TAXON_ID=1077150 /ORGANISM="Erythrolobus australicus, Strain CCMP3124" /LENGTH=59 /DNA_ID=CAMNT_0028535875 /DNA_START=248 /DNA_END=427 /DNA_ORIENTATION=-